MYLYSVSSDNKTVNAIYKDLYISSETSSGVSINQITYRGSQTLEINNIITFNTEPKLIIPITK